jgi:LuxR family maltose regulon positive regulatory protein
MAASLLTTKLYVPPLRPDLVPRPRLLELMDEGLRLGRKMTLVSAPAGFGKTTLVAEWLQRAGQPHAWLSLDEGDNDPVLFFSYVSAALQQVDEAVGRTAQSMLGSPQLAPADSLVSALINDVATVSEPFVLVLDDYHVIRAEWIRQAVEFLVAHQPPQMHLVVATRRDPVLSLARLRAGGQMTEIRAGDLRFAADEAAAFLGRTLGSALDAGLVAALEARTEGWIAGLQMAALSMQGRDAEHVAAFVEAFGGSHRHVIDYLVDEVLARQPADVRDFVTRTAVLDRFTAPLCDAVTGRDDGDAFLRQIEEANLFLIPLDERREWYRYHRLFADFLQSGLDNETAAALHLRAMDWLVAHDHLPEAVEHALASGDVDAAARTIASAIDGALHSASFMTLLRWLDGLPDERVRADCELATAKGLVLFVTDQRIEEAGSCAAAAESSMAPDAPPPVRGRLQSLQAHLALCDEDPDGTIRLSEGALHDLDEDDLFFRSLTFNIWGQALESQGDTRAAAEIYRRAATLGPVAGNEMGALVVLTNLVSVLNEMGRRREALAICRQVIEQDRVVAGSPLAEGIYLAWSLLSYEANELGQAREQVVRALDLCERANITDGILLARHIMARVFLAGGEVGETLALIRETRHVLERIASPDPFKATWFDALEAQVHLQQGDLAAAARWAEEAGIAPTDSLHRWNEGIYAIYVRLLLAQGRLEDAGTLLTRMEASAGKGGRQRRLITAHLQRALVELARGREQQALARAEEALHLAADEGYVRAFLDEGRAIVELLPRLRPVAPGFVHRVLEGAGATPAQPGAPALIEALSEREMEIVRLIAAGRSNPEIAELLYLSLNTIKWHVKNVYGKLQVGNRVEAAARAQELGLL